MYINIFMYMYIYIHMYIYTYVYREVKSNKVAEKCSVSARWMGGVSAYKCIHIYTTYISYMYTYICKMTLLNSHL